MATPIGICETPAGNWALVRHLDRHDLAGIAPAVHAWIDSIPENGAGGVGFEA